MPSSSPWRRSTSWQPAMQPRKSFATSKKALLQSVTRLSHFPSWHVVADHRLTAAGSGRGSPFHSLEGQSQHMKFMTVILIALALIAVTGVLYLKYW
jgi:hypothetical protein